MSRIGMIHGRFQPFHYGHLEYLKLAYERSDLLVIGITNADPWEIVEESASHHRHRSDANPYTFFERQLMIREVLRDEGIPLERVIFVPFPINRPERAGYYAPSHVTQYVRVFSEWEQSKVERLRARGYQVEVLTPGADKEFEATDVRHRLDAQADWEALVPAGVARVIERLGKET